MNMKKFLELASILTLVVWGVLFLHFYVDGRVEKFLSPSFRLYALIAGEDYLSWRPSISSIAANPQASAPMNTCMAMPAITTKIIIRTCTIIIMIIIMSIIMSMARAAVMTITRNAGTITLTSLSRLRGTFTLTKSLPAVWFLT